MLTGREGGMLRKRRKEWVSEVIDAGGQRGSRMRGRERFEGSRTSSKAAKALPVLLISIIINLLLT